jgi:hypothetical protein
MRFLDLSATFLVARHVERACLGIVDSFRAGGSVKSAGGGIRTHGGLRHRISHPEADLKCGTTLIGRPAPLT